MNNNLIRFGVLFVISALFLYFIGFIIAGLILLIGFIVNRIIAYRKAHQRFTDWEYDGKASAQQYYIDGERFWQRGENFKRYDRELGVWETKTEMRPKVGIPNKNSTMDEIFDYYGPRINKFPDFPVSNNED